MTRMQRLGALPAPQCVRLVDPPPAPLAANLSAGAREGVRTRRCRGRYTPSCTLLLRMQAGTDTFSAPSKRGRTCLRWEIMHAVRL